jgi:hypothetical protein
MTRKEIIDKLKTNEQSSINPSTEKLLLIAYLEDLDKELEYISRTLEQIKGNTNR